jgi:hypothetical protein
MPSRAARITFLAISLILCLTLLGKVFHLIAPSVMAEIRDRGKLQEGALAPAISIEPTSVSVINFAELAAKDAKAGKEIKPNALPALKAVHPPLTITESGAAIAERPPSANAQSNEIHPLVSSPAPSQSFLAQEDGPQVGTGSLVIPPDTMGAVGLDKLFVNVNNNYRVQDKITGTDLSTVSIETFWSSTGASGVFDPRVQYDPYNNRWMVAATSNGATANSSILVGVSATSDPLGTFTLFRFKVGCAVGAGNCDPGGETADFPMLGFNKNWVAVAWNQFQISGSGSLVSGKMLAIDYPTLRTGTATSTVFTVTTATNPAAFCMHPATTLSSTEDTLYVPAHLSSANATYRLHKLTGTSSAPAYVLDTVSKTRPGGGWTQPGGDILPQTCIGLPGVVCPSSPRSIDSGDAFIRSNVVFRNDNIWYAQTVLVQAHVAAQWTRVDTAGSYVDGGRVEDPTANFASGEWYAYPSIAVNINNDVLLGFSNFSTTHFVCAGYAMRLGTDGAGTMRDPVIFKEGEDYYSKDFGGPRNRWGDYSHTVVDPTNDQDMWTIQEYAGTRVVQDGQQTTNNSRWGTWWAKVPPTGAPPSPTPTPTPRPCLTFTVNDAGDAGDATPGDVMCATAGGACTLRAAIQEAAALPACGTIVINITGITGSIILGAPLPDINHSVSINGPGANQLTVMRSTAPGIADFRIFTIPQFATAFISGLTISNGRLPPNQAGGGVSNRGTLTMSECNVYGNNLNPSNSDFTSGGGVFNAGSMTLNNCHIGGTAPGQGNGSNLFGAGISEFGTMTMTGGSIVGNAGAGISVTNSLGGSTLINVNIVNNTVTNGSGVAVGGALTLINCLVSNNSVLGNSGGVINVEGGILNVIDTTISGNTGGAGIRQANNGVTNLVNVTITNNRLDSAPGAGIDNSFGTLTLANTIVAGNFRGASASDINGVVAASSSFNLIGTGGSGGLTDGANHNHVGVTNPMLGPLASNGGPTQTHALLPGSPAIDAGSNALAKDQNSNPLITDQRGTGFSRIVNTSADIGAFEAANVIQLLLEDAGPAPDQMAALDSALFSRDPFPVVNGADLLNLGADRNTRVIVFVAYLQWLQGEPSSSVVINLVDNNNQGFDVTAEDVRPVPNSAFIQVIFRLPDTLAAGKCTLRVKAHGQSTNAGTIRIRI